MALLRLLWVLIAGKWMLEWYFIIPLVVVFIVVLVVGLRHKDEKEEQAKPEEPTPGLDNK